MENKCQSVEPDESNSSPPDHGLRKDGLVLKPVAENESGEGAPYAPVDWPKPGDIWRWKVGNRVNHSGFWQDRYLYLPTSLQKPIEKGRFASMLAVKRYVQQEFPDADVDAFFASFSWRIPATNQATEGDRTILGKHRKEKMNGHSQSDLKEETVDCKVGNWMCRLQLQARNYSVPAMACDICCSEAGFCRDCCCILCCKSVDWAYGGYSFIRCEAKVTESHICGHVAHIDCALRSYMAGTVGGNSGLDAEYYCRRCDKRSDLIEHVTRLLQTCESLDSRDDIEKILNVGLRILGGSQQDRSKRLLYHIEVALAKLKNGSSLEDVWKMENSLAVSAGETTLSTRSEPQNGPMMEITTNLNQKSPVVDGMQQNHELVTSSALIESSKLDERIKRDLQDLKDSQEYEYRIADERLSAQKDLILGLYHQLEVERSELAKRTSSSVDTTGNVDALITNIMNRVNQIKKEGLKLKHMMEVAKGFGRVPKVILKEHFGLQIGD